MKISAQEEYGLRILLRIAHANSQKGLTIAQLAELEGLSNQNVAKLCRVLRMNNFLKSTRGQTGGYTLVNPAKEIKIKKVLYLLGGKLYDDDFCTSHSGLPKLCTNSVDCSIKSLWKVIQFSVDKTLLNITLHDLIGSESELKKVCMENDNKEMIVEKISD